MHEKAKADMIYLGFFVLFFGLIRLLVALTNFVTNVYLPQAFKTDENSLVSILIPARNEEQNIDTLLNDITKLTYNNIEVIVYDDLSEDKTADVVNKHIKINKKIKLIHGGKLESGWGGKNYACYQLSQKASGKYYLFLDADVRVSGSLIEKSVLYTQKYKLGLLSIFPKQILDNFGAWLTVPLMNWILLSLLPLILIRLSNWVSFSAANGQFMLFDAEVYQKFQPHNACKTIKVEDIAICQYLKRNKIKVKTLLGNESIQCRMYSSFKEGLNGFSKNVFAFFGNSIVVGLLFALLTTFAPAIIFYVFGINVLCGYLVCIGLIRILVSKSSSQPIWLNLLLMPLQQIVFLLIILNAIVKQKSKTLDWKGRNIS